MLHDKSAMQNMQIKEVKSVILMMKICVLLLPMMWRGGGWCRAYCVVR